MKYQVIFHIKSWVSFHYAKDARNFGQKLNGKVLLYFFQSEYLGSPLEVVHLCRQNILSKLYHPIIDKLVHCPSSFHLCQKRNKNGKGHSISWPSLIGKCHSIFLMYIVLLISDWSVWRNGTHPKNTTKLKAKLFCCDQIKFNEHVFKSGTPE